PLEDRGEVVTEVIVRIDGHVARFAGQLEEQGLAVQVGGLDMGRDELIVPVDDPRVYDLVRDLAVHQGAGLRSIRPRARTLEDIYLGDVGAAREANDAAS